jgi:hypothetical protein
VIRQQSDLFKKQAWPVPAFALAMAALVTACGGGGSNTGVTPSKTTFAGNVIDGYIEGATVCLDLNANLQCDSDEPKDTTKADGTYLLEVTGVALDKLKLAQLVTVVPDTAKDADDGGQTLKEARKSGFSLMAPASAYVKADGDSVTGAVISPLTTLVSHEMLTGNNTLETSEKYVRERLGLPTDTDLRQDFVAKKAIPLIEKAQMLTVAIGNIKAAALADEASKPTEKEALFAALAYLQQKVADLQTAFDQAKKDDSSGSAKPVDLVKTALEKDAAKPDTQAWLAEAKKTTASQLTPLVALIEQGFYNARYVYGTCSASGSSSSASGSSSCTPNYGKVQGSGGKLVEKGYGLVDPDWQLITNNEDEDDFVLTSKGWVAMGACPSGQSNTYEADSAGGATVTFCDGRSLKGTAHMVDASGKTLLELGLGVPSSKNAISMPSGAQLYWFDLARTKDEYNLWTNSKVEKFVWQEQPDSPPIASWEPFKSIEDFIKTNSTANAANGQRFSFSGLHFSFDEGGTQDGGKLTLWSDDTSVPNATVTGSAAYERREVFGEEVLVIKAAAPDNRKGELLIFAMKEGNLYGGVFKSAAVKSLPQAHFNKTMINAILKAGNKPEVVD